MHVARTLLCGPLLMALWTHTLDARAEPQATSAARSLRGGAAIRAARQLGSLDALPRYDVELDLEPNERRFKLKERVHYTQPQGSRALDEVVFVIYANMAGAKRAGGAAAIQLIDARCGAPLTCTLVVDDAGFMHVKLPRALAPHETVAVEFELDGELPEFSAERTGFSGQMFEALGSLLNREPPRDFGLLAFGNDIMSMGGFLAVLAPQHAGVWELSEPTPLGDLTSDEMAQVRARIRVPRGMAVATPGVVVSRRALNGLREELEIEAELVRDFAVVASTAFVVRERQVQGVRVKVYVSPESAGAADKVLSAACEALGLFESTFGGFPYAELEVAEAPLVGGVGGVEFSGLVTVARMLLNQDEGGDESSGMLQQLTGALGGGMGMPETPKPSEMLDMVVAHEVAHQWWHVLVGSDSRHDPFVDEGLAQWSALYFLERTRGAAVARRAENQLVMSYQMMRMLGARDQAVDRPVESFATNMIYGGLVYGKGPLVYRELRRSVGDPSFKASLRRYVARYEFRLAPKRSFIELLLTAGNRARVSALADHWLEQTHGDRDLGGLMPGSKQGKKSPLDLSGLLKGLGGLGGMHDLGALTTELFGK